MHDGVLAQSGLRDSALHELYGCMYAVHFTARPTCMPSLKCKGRRAARDRWERQIAAVADSSALTPH